MGALRRTPLAVHSEGQNNYQDIIRKRRRLPRAAGFNIHAFTIYTSGAPLSITR
jgi:hypothetical protein